MHSAFDTENVISDGSSYMVGPKDESFVVIQAFPGLVEKPIAAGEVTAVEPDVLDGEAGEEPLGGVCVRFGNHVVAVFGV